MWKRLKAWLFGICDHELVMMYDGRTEMGDIIAVVRCKKCECIEVRRG